MFWIALALLVVLGSVLLRRRRAEGPAREPWQEPEPAEEEPLDLDEIRKAEAEWAAEGDWGDPPEEVDWR